MRQLYTLEEVHRYRLDLEYEEAKAVKTSPDTHQGQLVRTTARVMREFYLRMNESLERHGPARTGLFARMFAARQIRLLGKDYLRVGVALPGQTDPSKTMEIGMKDGKLTRAKE